MYYFQVGFDQQIDISTNSLDGIETVVPQDGDDVPVESQGFAFKCSQCGQECKRVDKPT